MTYALTDSLTMLRRNLRRLRRYPSLTLFIAGIPVVLLLLFVYVFGGTLGAGIGADYVDYVTPGIVLFTVVGAAQSTAIQVSTDMTEGIIARFRTMAIWRASVIAGHVIASVAQILVSVITVLAVALLIGFHPTAGVREWLAAAALIVLVAFAVTWFAVGCGLVAKDVATASNLPMVLLLLPFLGSGFVPTDSMPAGLAWFAAHQPFTPINETLRGLLLGGPTQTATAVAWCLGTTAVGYVWSLRLYSR
jgi:ABC-2 type transport system permease protein